MSENTKLHELIQLFRYNNKHVADLSSVELIEISDLFEQLEKYQAVEEQGRLVKLPFMVGDRVYQINENFIEPCTVEVIFLADYTDKDGNYCNMAEIHYDRDDCPYVSTEIYFTDIGKTVFLEKSEAEAKLNELRRENE